MTDYKKNLKALALLLGLAVALPFSAQAQTTKSMYHEESLLDDPMSKNFQNGLMGDRSGGLGVAQWTLTNDYFGETPVGSGIAILIAAGAGYALTRRRKEEKQ